MCTQTKYYIGTSGWSYPRGEGTWTGRFYPHTRVNELEYYSQFFNTVEVNSSFYRPPDPRYVDNWARQVPEGFLFSVKLWQKFTHPEMYREATGLGTVITQKDVDLFRYGIEPLIKYGKLGALLAQFPPSFKNEMHTREILDSVIRIFGEYRLAVELRHRSWSDDEHTGRRLKESNVAWVQIDEPKFESSIAEDLPVTSDIGYFRFHGRNKKMWWRGDSEARYQYLYSPEAIDELAGKIRVVGAGTNLTFVFFNNHWQGYAPRNAIDTMKALKLPCKDFSSPVPDKDEQKTLPGLL